MGLIHRGPPGNFTYETTFDLTANNVAPFVLAGRLATDNALEVFLQSCEDWYDPNRQRVLLLLSDPLKPGFASRPDRVAAIRRAPDQKRCRAEVDGRLSGSDT